MTPVLVLPPYPQCHPLKLPFSIPSLTLPHPHHSTPSPAHTHSLFPLRRTFNLQPHPAPTHTHTSFQAFGAIISLSTIALNIAYVAPSFVRITFGRKRFTPGPFTLGRWAYPINTIATLWVAFAVVGGRVFAVKGGGLGGLGRCLGGSAPLGLLYRCCCCIAHH